MISGRFTAHDSQPGPATEHRVANRTIRDSQIGYLCHKVIFITGG
jgi:hypothetical protein